MLKKTLFSAVIIILFTFIVFSSVEIKNKNSLIHHHLQVELFPAKSFIRVHDTITIPRTIEEKSLFFLLHENLKIISNSTPITVVKQSEKIKADFFKNHPAALLLKEKISLNLYSIHSLKISEQRSRISFVYEGRIYHPIERIDKEYARGFSETPGIISEKGIYLAGSSCWIPWFNDELMTFTLDSMLPGSWNVISQGKRICHEKNDNRKQTTWDSPNPVDEIFLIANNFTEYKKMCDNVEILAFLRSPDNSLAQRYLSTTCQYLDMYQFLIGPYLYSKFALVENFWETGYGMPSFTLLGPRVIRFPFILHSSYPHEILHNWWGNGVFVNYETGNWCEGITAYMADHLIKEQKGQGTEYRRTTLQNYSDYVNKHQDFPLSQFKFRHDAASAAVGYGKALMVFHMLRNEVGDNLFIRSWQKFFKDNKFKKASFNDIRKAFEMVCQKDFKDFFKQWISSTGAPKLQITDVEIYGEKECYKLKFRLSQTQKERLFILDIPVAVSMKNQKEAIIKKITLKNRQQDYTFFFFAPPTGIQVDPQFDVFRKIHYLEVPPALSRAFGAQEALIILPSQAEPTLLAGYRELAQKWAKRRGDNIKIQLDNNIKTIPKNRTIWIMGWENIHMQYISEELKNHDCNIGEKTIVIEGEKVPIFNKSLVITLRNSIHRSQVMVFLATEKIKALPGLSRKLPHYGKYSYLVFDGHEPTNIKKGQWSITESPLIINLRGPGTSFTHGKLPRRKPLIERSQFFSH